MQKYFIKADKKLVLSIKTFSLESWQIRWQKDYRLIHIDLMEDRMGSETLEQLHFVLHQQEMLLFQSKYKQVWDVTININRLKHIL